MNCKPNELAICTSLLHPESYGRPVLVKHLHLKEGERSGQVEGPAWACKDRSSETGLMLIRDAALMPIRGKR